MRYLKSPVPTMVGIADLPGFSIWLQRRYRSPRCEAIRVAEIAVSILFTMACYASRPGEGEDQHMAAENFHEERLCLAAYDDRVKELFKVFAEGLAQGEPERPSQDRFRRALRFAKRARNLALQAVEMEKTEVA